ncbi:PorV/PorQ family protein [Candidatus Aerophobetes bacterium]|nr:PorV/PorQ family protein [Candidatus Aerophobetes bacterium]
MEKRLIPLLPVIIFIVIFSLSQMAGANDVGTSGANFLKIGVGARAAALGDAFTALTDDGSSIYWNPAGLTKIKNRQFFATYNMWFQEISQGYLSYVLPSEKSVWGFALNYTDMGKIQGYDELGEPTYQFGASNLLFQIAYAKNVGKDLSLGIAAGYLADTIDADQQAAFHTNIGLIKSLPSLDVGLAIQNLGSSLKEDPLPLTYKVGFALKMSSFNLSFDVAFPADNKTHFVAVGLEVPLSQTFTLRAGSRYNRYVDSEFSCGLGFNLEKVSFDYAYVPYARLGDTHRVSMGLKL